MQQPVDARSTGVSGDMSDGDCHTCRGVRGGWCSTMAAVAMPDGPAAAAANGAGDDDNELVLPDIQNVIVPPPDLRRRMLAGSFTHATD